jgi:TetR/AcrR family transcriptional repressor of nem operon
VNEEPATEKGRATRQKIVDAATSVVQSRGVEGATLEEICRTASVSKGQLYHYFVSKQSLIQAVAQNTVDKVLFYQESLFATKETFSDFEIWVETLVNLQVELDARGGCPIGSLVPQLADNDEGARAVLADGFLRWEMAIRESLRQLKKNGALRPEVNVDEGALQLLASLQGGLLLSQVRKDPTQLRVILDGALLRLRDHAPSRTEEAAQSARLSSTA